MAYPTMWLVIFFTTAAAIQLDWDTAATSDLSGEVSCGDTSGDAVGLPEPPVFGVPVTCQVWTDLPFWCKNSHYYDDSDFTAAAMCCACGGGIEGGSATSAPTTQPATTAAPTTQLATTAAPTTQPATTAAPTTQPATTAAVSAAGDPHMTSVTGAKFDILRSGNHTLLHIPQHSLQEDALVFVRAFVKHEGATCLDMYIETLNITGKLAEERQRGGFSFFANQGGGVSKGWLSLGKLDLKVVYGTTVSGVRYLNMFARHLAKLGMPIGGILGLDDHESAATPEAGCQRRLALYSAIPEEDMEKSGGRASWASL